MSVPDGDHTPDYPALLRADGVFVVLGAGQGIGRQAALALGQAGAHVLVVDRDAALAQRVAGEVVAAGGAASAHVADIIQRAGMVAVADAANAIGRLRGVIDIVGMAQYGSIVDTTDEQFAWHEDIILRHAWLAVQVFGPRLAAAGGGTMTFVASVSGVAGAAMHAAYGIFKAGLMSLVRSAACEFGPSGVRTNAVAPGVVWTPRVSGYLGQAGHDLNVRNAPLRRVALPADIAAALLFLATPLSGYVNGQTLLVDGGVSAKFGYEMPEVAR